MSGVVSSDTELTDGHPTERGWYATVRCWEPEEGMFPSATFWDGERWQPETNATIQYWPKLFGSATEAEHFAYEHDLER